MSLVNLETFSESELDRLRTIGVVSTKDLYERCPTRSERAELAQQTGLTEEQLTAALELVNLVRINGVGPAFARFLRDLGIRSPQDFLQTDSTDILRRYQEKQENAATLRVEDLEYCRRFCVGLASDIVW
jgi:nucleotidyltransferase/DNA polymerase involved in DNA repair